MKCNCAAALEDLRALVDQSGEEEGVAGSDELAEAKGVLAEALA
jgi:hypothetical protein